ncbi:hypothetical protein [Mycolicibacterium sarraceniae]|uniref:Uncharacterized protein n=1 Tax=Mycolicibacterium sarraceniae TaxID=1534348 RepID=A0A7I7STK5_9MYCO|nr:hypothetical protein [Mycolicibacterium sarraceniae]BBY60342.1 hypothetical protein MSAR_34780 [Mycolicibacterium sarraceniae]
MICLCGEPGIGKATLVQRGEDPSRVTVPLAVGLPMTNLLPAVEHVVIQPFQNLLNVAGVFSDPLQDGLYVVGLLGPVITGLSAAGTGVRQGQGLARRVVHDRDIGQARHVSQGRRQYVRAE